MKYCLVMTDTRGRRPFINPICRVGARVALNHENLSQSLIAQASLLIGPPDGVSWRFAMTGDPIIPISVVSIDEKIRLEVWCSSYGETCSI